MLPHQHVQGISMSTNEAIAAIRGYLVKEFPDSMVEHKPDFDLCAQSFKVCLPVRTLLLKVSDEFIGDNPPDEILRQFNLWAIAEILQNEKKLGVMVSHQGLAAFPRD